MGNFNKNESESLGFIGLKIPRDYYYQWRLQEDRMGNNKSIVVQREQFYH